MNVGNQNRHYLIAGYDFTKYVLQKDGIVGKQSKPDWGQLPSISQLQFTVNNADGIFSSLTQQGIFRGQNLKQIPLQVFTQQGTTQTIEWEGVIDSIQEDYSKYQTVINGMSPWQVALDTPCLNPYGSLDPSIGYTPAFLSKTLFQLFNIPVDDTAYAYADYLLSGRVTTTVDPNMGTSNVALKDVQTQLATVGFGRVFPNNGKMSFEVFDETQAANPTITEALFERDVKNKPTVTSEDSLPVAFRVNYVFGFINSPNYNSILANAQPQQQTLDFSTNQIVKVASLDDATIIGAQWEKIKSYIHRKRVEFAIKKEKSYNFNLFSWIYFNYARAGFVNTPLEIISVDQTDPRYALIQGRFNGR